ncbi:hypothetical protein [Actinoplanes awajinensis]|uniref:Uncharacterized protein n=1 Tax=Actinoplanes awajinensis subsp. mycoplanecinus TaxID=135947 RepID=A0A124GAR2_9ACTN|nr:hypothetical protein [Actinoplanes awajinensis]KUL33010.1 hypothetical protein ADL15_18500 [Actinoplanes awajinensis subsp. mycoplanecinus]
MASGGSWWRAARLILIAAWVVAAGAAWWSAPRQTDVERATADIAAGRVVAYEWGAHWNDNGPDRWFSVPMLYGGGTAPTVFAWRTPDNRTHWIDTNGDATQIAQLRASVAESPSANVLALSTLINGIGLLFTVVFLGMILAGRPPVIGTKWYWFWLFALVPFGLGLLYWTFREVPWTKPTVFPPLKDDGSEHRLRGLRGLVTAFLISVAVSFALYGLRALLGEGIIPDLLSP